MNLKAQAVRLGGPADSTGKIVAEGSLDKQRQSVPVSLNLNPERIIGEARIHPDGTADIRLKEGFTFKPATHDFTIGYKVLKSHKEGDVNVIDELDVLTLGIVRKAQAVSADIVEDASHEHVFNAYNVLKHDWECSTCHKTKAELAKAQKEQSR